MAVSHVLVDGLSGLHFVNVWATIARGEQPSRADMPFLDRNVLQQRIDVISDTGLTGFPFPQPPLLIGKSGNLEEREKPTNLLVLKLTKQNIDKLREIANEGGAKYSRFEVVAGHIWRCATEARRHRSEQPTNLYVRVDFRSRLNPPLPPHYFGNAIIQAAATALSGELLRNGLGYAAGRIREAVMSITDEYVRKNLAMATQIPDVAEFYGNPNMTITSWINLPLHRTDFGWGKEVYMGPGLVRGDGKSFIMPLSGDGDDNSNGDDGTLRVLLCLQQQYVEAFEDFFYEHF
ncbi:unnamed protein product [Cuscuta europaea]|uniref:Uncharacterized protein n=1 Tax=Cuscuta europaea TaxID=41803 RepID=A0A9P0Z867_CUSEU|nr:unnamed protein product [Cuscuta europaea]